MSFLALQEFLRGCVFTPRVTLLGKHSPNSESLQYTHIPHLSKRRRSGSCGSSAGKKGGCGMGPNRAKYRSIQPNHHFPNNIVLGAYSVPSRAPCPPGHPQFPPGAVRRAENFGFSGQGLSTLPSRRAGRQRDEPQQLPGFRRGPEGFSAAASLLLSPRGRCSAGRSARPSAALRSDRRCGRHHGGTFPFPALPLLPSPPRRW